MPDRICGKKVRIDNAITQDFFRDRATRRASLDPVVAMLYQDSNPELARARDRQEKQVFWELLAPQRDDRVLDLGCGVGRWAAAFAGKVDHYSGLDPTAGFIEVARKKYGGLPEFTFHICAAEEADVVALLNEGPFTIILLTGVLHYLNDDACAETLRKAGALAATNCRILIRSPIGSKERLTLNGVWSEELKHRYSAIYRTREEHVMAFNEILVPAGFSLQVDDPLYEADLNNRRETHQHYFLLERS